MATVTVRGARLGEGRPAVIVPVQAVTGADLATQARAAVDAGADLVEWRIDALAGPAGQVQRLGALVPRLGAQLRAALDDAPGGERVPILATVRTHHEGGAAVLDAHAYGELLETVAASGVADLLDVEALWDPETARSIIAAAQRAGIAVVASSHDVHATPPAAQIAQRLASMQDLGADIAKIAVMPRTAEDVLTLLSGTLSARHSGVHIPLIAISMGRLGAITRLAGSAFGSCATFATVGTGSAPGQMDARGVRAALDLLQGA